MEDETDMHYDPPGQPERLSTRAKVPRQPLGLNKRAIVVAACLVGGVIGVVIISAFSPSPPSELPKAETTWSPHPSEVVQSLPNDYDEMERKRREEERRKQFTQRASVGEKTVKSATPSQEEKILLEYEVTRLKQAINARESDLEFKGAYQQVRAFRGTQQGSSYGAQASGAGEDMSGLSNTGAFNPRDDDNRQDEKRGFLSEARDEKTHLSGRVRSATSRYELMAGTVIPGLMVTGVNSDLPGQVVGQISEHVYDSADGSYVLIPQGTKVVGVYDSRITYGQERVLLVWERLIFPNGSSISLEGMPGVDMSGYAGLKDKVNNHFLRLASGVVLGSLLGAGAQIAYGDYQNINPDFSQLALQGAGQNINQVGQKITQKNLNIQPTLEIRPGSRFHIFVTKDITLLPYRE